MGELKKITTFVDPKHLDAAQRETGAGITETVNKALETLGRQGFYRRMLAAKGKIKFDDFNLDELREDREFDEHGNVIDRG